jgi:predicted glycosyltransferase
MGGYNTVCEILSSDARALVVPRTEPRREQLIRAERLRDLGALDMLEPQRLSADALGAWLAAPPSDHAHARAAIDLDGLNRVPRLLDELLAKPPAFLADGGATTPSRRFMRKAPAPATNTGSVSA